ncbi:MAG: alanine--tRNA ligase, partial [Cyclobacteriaceae bacterium]|nr:alanine--tRNA ligase [Cyclobacteriaceae bacterium]
MESKVIRKKFLEFFEGKGHKVVPSAPIVVQNDPTLMFTNAGMNQFKDYFLGNKQAEWKRVADTQKCLRVSGKHNDLEEVGFDTYHHTMFEMLGNWSFGDYFKKDAIAWAWELLEGVFGLPKDRMYATVFEGDAGEGLAPDDEARDYWKNYLPEERVLNGSKKDNFWEMGDTGPCGPCSEIHIDLRPQSEVDKIPGRELVNRDHPQVVEIWNLVFIQFNRMSDGKLVGLPDKHVDTGMGFERLAMAIQGKQSNYDTDVFQPMIQEIARRAGVAYGDNEKTDIAIRVIADHIRAISFTIADGQLPGNAKAGYVIRRILRRAVRYGYTFLGFNQPFLTELVPVLARQFEDTFPELMQQSEFVGRVIREEELSFLRTLENGLKRFDLLKSEIKNKVVDGTSAFELYDTYGFPVDLTSLIARENGFSVDIEGFEKEMKVQRERSKSAARQEAGDWVTVHADAAENTFIGYDHTQSASRIHKYREVNQKGKSFFQLVLDQTPFYAESGGQVGDKGWLSAENEKINVFDTKRENDLIIHYVTKLPANPEQTFTALVDEDKRRKTQNNHSATHLLHAALRQVLGSHVQQRGSLVNDETLRFDFSHFSKMTEEELADVERIVNQKIRENIVLDERRNVPIDEAKNMGAMALFGEKYGDFVRVVTFDRAYSVELCGGTHVKATGQIGYFKLTAESSVAAGVRRIEALTADGTERFFNEKMATLTQIDELLKNPKDPVRAIAQLLEERQALSKELEALHKGKAGELKKELLSRIQPHGALNLILFKGAFPDADSIKNMAFELKNEVENLVLVLAADLKSKPFLTVMLAD